jgi:multisubunit Na+/H+ antiporter MnhE subunit
MVLYIAFFVLGFLTDKIRLFPFLLGLVIGIILTLLLENVFEQNVSKYSADLYELVLGTDKIIE